MNCTEEWERRVLRSHIDWSGAGFRLADYLGSRYPRLTPEQWKERIAEGEILLNGKLAEADQVLALQDCVEYFPGDQVEPEADMSYSIIYEDDMLLIINKSGNLCVHPAGPFFKHTLWHELGKKYGEIHFINRLDRETSGLLIAARTPEIAAKLGNRKWPIRKEYLALVFGNLCNLIEAKGFLIPDTGSSVAKKRKFISERPLDFRGVESADTELRPEQALSRNRTLVRAVPHTGRLHQIRATLYSLGYPLLGDKLYGRDERIFRKIRERTITGEDLQMLGMKRQALHSTLLEFPHPVSGKTLLFEAPLPEDIQSQLR